MRKAQRIVQRLVIAFDTAEGAFSLQKQPGFPVASAELRQALDEARALGDAAELQGWWAFWVSAQAQARCWLESHEDVRRGMTSCVHLTMRTLSRFNSNSIAEPEPKQDWRDR